MKRPWQIWLLYAVGLAGVAGAFGWLTVKALELDRAESLARRQAELEEDVSSALWRMDAELTPILADEATRPDFVYHPVYPTEPPVKGGKPPAQELSPLLVRPPNFVLLHFEVHPDGCVISPQNPVGDDNAWALRNGASLERVNAAARLLEELKPALSIDALLAQLPQHSVPASGPWQPPGQPGGNSAAIVNNYDFAQQARQQQLEQAVQPQPPQYLVNPPAQQPAANPGQEDSQPPAQSQSGGQQAGSQLAYNNSGYGNNVESGRLQRSQSRADNDLPNRQGVFQAAAQRAAEQRGNLRGFQPAVRVVEGASRVLWLGDHLVMARRVQIGEQTVVQGCWLDWQQLKEMLRWKIADVLPEVELTPLKGTERIKLSRVLATIPVQLSVPAPTLPPVAWTPIRVSLVVAWLCLVATALAAALMLHSVVALSERRGAFVSAVTHELRTPLTTFRMYAEMLSAGMVPEGQQRQHYLETLRIEADRLAHLVENVLQYARLERGRPGKRRESVSIHGLLDRSQARLADRAAQAEMKLVVELAGEDAEVSLATDSAAVEQILFNLVDNACKYAVNAADKRIHLAIAVQPRQVQFTVRDHGPGISASGRRRLFQPFSKSVHEAANTAPGVGLGLALSRRLAGELGGRLQLNSPVGGGCAFVLTLPRT
ncbi:MAG TPA: HAMP domain-containing sensor histidine kinase [Pirellulaceae bacterium]|nr:HAMP domain-containing sensor histidine kinase [Pirellulaceae bacterium]